MRDTDDFPSKIFIHNQHCWYILRGDKVNTYISTPDICGKDLILLIEVQNLNECEAVVNSDGLRRVVDGPAYQTYFLIVFKQMFDKPFLIGHCQAPCKKIKNSFTLMNNFWAMIEEMQIGRSNTAHRNFTRINLLPQW